MVYITKQAHCLTSLELEPCFCNLSNLVTLNKKLMRGSRLRLENQFLIPNYYFNTDRARDRFQSETNQHDEEIIIPLTTALGPRNDMGVHVDTESSVVTAPGATAAASQKDELGLIAGNMSQKNNGRSYKYWG